MIYNILLIVQIIVALSIISLVLIQHGKGADAGAAFGGGSSGTVFGSAGASNFLSRSTGILAAVFFANSLALAWIVSHSTGEAGSLVDSVTPTPTTQVVVPAPVSDVPGGSAVPVKAPATTGVAPAADVPTQSDVPAVPSTPPKTEPVDSTKVIVPEPAATAPAVPSTPPKAEPVDSMTVIAPEPAASKDATAIPAATQSDVPATAPKTEPVDSTKATVSEPATNKDAAIAPVPTPLDAKSATLAPASVIGNNEPKVKAVPGQSDAVKTVIPPPAKAVEPAVVTEPVPAPPATVQPKPVVAPVPTPAMDVPQ